MRKDEFKAGVRWAQRSTRALASPAERVEAILWADSKPKMVKVRRLDGELAGLEEFVRPVTLICRWSDWPARLRAEMREAALIDWTDQHPCPNKVECEAAARILASSGEDLYVDEYRGYTVIHDPGAVERVADRAAFTNRPWTQKPAFTWQHRLYTPNEYLIALARAFASKDPQAVGLHIDAKEAEYRTEGFTPGNSHLHELARRHAPAWALARQWAGGQEQHDHLRREIDRLRSIAQDAAYTLARLGHQDEANRIEGRLRGR